MSSPDPVAAKFREHVKVIRTLYSAPWKLIGRRVAVRSTATMVQIFHEGMLVKTHAALEQGKRTRTTTRPKRSPSR
ncbi:Mu transposase domain-containing protein [Streptomyces sp. NPDC086033]|uniref:Mu transposase domain-containing protein n=1 Tax=unclassified Streptomyces TaxID=2593676 RepID=UPI00352223BF